MRCSTNDAIRFINKNANNKGHYGMFYVRAEQYFSYNLLKLIFYSLTVGKF